jgi:hypothetical protein
MLSDVVRLCRDLIEEKSRQRLYVVQTHNNRENKKRYSQVTVLKVHRLHIPPSVCLRVGALSIAPLSRYKHPSSPNSIHRTRGIKVR